MIGTENRTLKIYKIYRDDRDDRVRRIETKEKEMIDTRLRGFIKR